MKLQEIKQQLDIIQIAERYGFEFSGKGNRLRAQENLFRDDSTSSLDFFKDTQKFYDRGDESIKGDVFDLIARRENITVANAIAKAKEMIGSTNHLPTSIAKPSLQKNKKIIDFNKLAYFAKQELIAGQSFSPVEVEIENQDKYLKINKIHHKLFETDKINIKHQKRVHYIFSNIIGYSQHWRAASIIIRDKNNQIVDLATYRPQKPENYQDWSDPKYIYKNATNRGDNFLFPFENLITTIIHRKEYFIIGEGLKNALNALIYDIPFISIESTGNTIEEKFLSNIKSLIDQKLGFATAFDGDQAGQKAYIAFIKKLLKQEYQYQITDDDITAPAINILFKQISTIEAKNIVEFNSGIDFTTFVTAA